MAGKVNYAQFLHDASEVRFRDASAKVHGNLNQVSGDGELTLNIPIVKPNIEVPTIELWLK